MANKNFVVKNGLEVGGQEVIDSSGVITSAALGGQTLGTTDSPTFAGLDVTSTVSFSGATVSDLGTVTTADINGGTIDGTDITIGAGKTLNVSAGTFTVANDQISGDAIDGGTATPTTVTSTTVNATTVDTTTIEVTNFAAKDGTSAGSIADSTGVVTIASSVLTTTDINGGTIDGVTLGGSSAGAITGTTGQFNTSLNVDGTVTADGLTVDSGSTALYATFNSTNANGGYLALSSSGTIHGDIGTAAQIVSGGSASDFGINARDSRNLIFGTVNVERARIDSSGLLTNQIGAVFNESGADSDFRVESDGNANMLFVDAGSNAVTVNTGTPRAVFTIKSSGNDYSGGSIGLEAALNTSTNYLTNAGGNFYISHDGTNDDFLISSSETVFNQTGVDRDFRVESDTNTHALFVDAGNSRVGIGESSPLAYLHVSGMQASSSVAGAIFSGTWPWLKFLDTETGQNTFAIYNDNALYFTRLAYADRNNAPNSGVDSLILYETQSVFNEDSNDQDFRVESDSNTHALFVDAGSNHVNIGTSTDLGALLNVGGNLAINGTDLNLLGNSGSGTDTKSIQIGHNRTGDGFSLVDFVSDTTYSDYGLRILRGNTGANAKSEITHRGTGKFIINASEGGNEIVLNEGSYDTDFRVESDSNSHMLFVDAGNNAVGINTSAPGANVGLTVDGQSDNVSISLLGDNPGATQGNRASIRFNADYTQAFEIGMGDNMAGGGRNFTIQETSTGASTTATAPAYVFIGNGDGRFYFTDSNDNIVVDLNSEAGQAFVFNENSTDTDFRVESDSNANMLFVDAGANSVNVGTNNSGYNGTFNVYSGTNTEVAAFESALGGAGAAATIRMGVSTRSSNGLILGSNGSSAAVNGGSLAAYMVNSEAAVLSLGGGNTFQLRLGTSEVVVNEGSADTDFRVESDNNANMLFVDAGNDKVSVGGSTPLGTLTVLSVIDGTEAAPHFAIQGAASNYRINMWLDATAAYIGQDSAIRAVRIYSGAETAGVSLANGGTSWGTFSDERLKESVEPVQNALQSLSGLRSVKYRLKDVDGPEDKKKIGLVAQDLVGVLDEIVDTTKRPGDDTDYLSVRYSEMVPVLVKAIQEQQEIINDLRARVAQLEGA